MVLIKETGTTPSGDAKSLALFYSPSEVCIDTHEEESLLDKVGRQSLKTNSVILMATHTF